jgi:peptidoglycan/xylan/chitin deacetylase (PgdA/CDA1 family)
MKVIMYHYVRPFNKDMPNFKALDIENFKKQLDFFEDEYGFVSKEDFNSSIKNGKACNGIVLTFDDGFKDHYRYVLPELLKRSLWGIFYIPTGPLSSSKLLDVHRIHILLGTYGGGVIFNSLKGMISDNNLSRSHVAEFKSITYNNQDSDFSTKMVKRILNYFIDYKCRGQVIDELMEIYFPNEVKVHHDFYMSKDDLINMRENGMIIGSHSKTHPVMSKLNYRDQEKEILESFNELLFVTDDNIKTFCYPYGGFHSFTNETMKILNDNDCSFSFNVESRDVKDKDLVNSPFMLPRYDCNEFPFGSCN